MDKATKREKCADFRRRMIEIAGHHCEKCQRHESDGAILQVHHTYYVRGKSYWEYDYSECDVLCMGCHAKVHGKIMPTDDWVLESDNDLGDLIGTCEYCGNSIRYEYHISHQLWENRIVGTYCCDELTGTTEASERQKLIRRRKAFLDPSKWISSGKLEIRTYKTLSCAVEKHDQTYILVVNGVVGKKTFTDELTAKTFLHSAIEDGSIKNYMQKQRGTSRE